MKMIRLPMFDQSGELTPIVIAALSRGATASNDPADPSNVIILMVEDDDPAVALLAVEDAPKPKPKRKAKG